MGLAMGLCMGPEGYHGGLAGSCRQAAEVVTTDTEGPWV